MEPTTAEEWREWWTGDTSYKMTISEGIANLFNRLEELEKARGLLGEAPVSPRNAFNTHWLERVRTFLEGSK